MFLGIAGHTDAEIGRSSVFKVLIQVNAVIQIHYLLDELGSIFMSAGFGYKAVFRLAGIALYKQHIFDAQEIQVNQGILGFFFGESPADDMRHGIHFVMVLDGRTNAYGSRPLAYRFAFQQTVFAFLVHKFFPVIGYIHERGIELHQRVYVVKKGSDVISLARR